MLAQVAARLRARQGGAGGTGGEVMLGEDGEAVLLDDNCTVSFRSIIVLQHDRMLTRGQVM